MALFLQPTLSSIAVAKQSLGTPVFTSSRPAHVRACPPTLLLPCFGSHKTKSLTTLFLLLQQWPTNLRRLSLITRDDRAAQSHTGEPRDLEKKNRIQRRYSRFFTISSQRRELSPARTLKWPRRNRVQITCNTSSAYHVQHVVLRATYYKGTAQLLSLTELKSHLLELKEGRKPEYPEKTPGDELQKMPHTTARRFKPQARLEPAQ